MNERAIFLIAMVGCRGAVAPEPTTSRSQGLEVSEHAESSGFMSVDCVLARTQVKTAVDSAAVSRRGFALVSRLNVERDLQILRFDLPGGGYDTVRARRVLVRVDGIVSSSIDGRIDRRSLGQVVAVNLPDLSSFERIDERGRRLRAARATPTNDSISLLALGSGERFAIIAEPIDDGWIVKEVFPWVDDSIPLAERSYSTTELASLVRERRSATGR